MRAALRGTTAFCISILAGSTGAQVTWQRTFGAFGTEQGRAIVEAGNGDLLTCGSTGSFGNGNSDIYVVRVNDAGDHIWSATFGGPGIEDGNDILALPDGNFLVVGTTNSFGEGGYDGYVVEFSAAGELLWQHTYGTSDWDLFNAVTRTTDGGFLFAGLTYGAGHGGADAWVVRTDGAGDLLWQEYYGDAGSDAANSVITVSSGGFVLAGHIGSNGEQDAWIQKIDDGGGEEWQVVLGGDSLDDFNDVIETSDLGFVAVGSTHSYHDFTEAYHAKVDAFGGFVWDHVWGQVGEQVTNGILESTSGDLVSIGYTTTAGQGGKDAFILFSDANGDFMRGVTNGGDGGTNDESGNDILRCASGGFAFTGYTESFGFGTRDLYLVRTNDTGWTDTPSVDELFDPLPVRDHGPLASFEVYPIPSSTGEVSIVSAIPPERIEIYDIRGGAVPYRSLGPLRILIDAPSGTYFIHAFVGAHTALGVQRIQIIH
ncbi:MAG: hypothetical protein H6595_13425 [Flavobacteriales bacterium]|nr:hypothetical protein [Flavobacteriales bacterium]MCB9168467.1 hypothetical protein [Flavobacteriales bacterium]